MFSFEGEFRRRPQQSFCGASKKEKRDDLLQRTVFDRQKREESRRRLQGAIQIQAFTRGTLTRMKQKREERSIFDAIRDNAQKELITNANEAVIENLAKRLLFFYNRESDSARLIWLCQVLLKHSNNVKNWITVNTHMWLYKIMKLEHLCLDYLEVSAKLKQPLAVPLRILEVFLEQKNYVDTKGVDKAYELVYQMVSYLVKRGFFKNVRSLVDDLIPISIELSVTATTPIAESLLQLLLKPLTVAATTPDIEFKSYALCEFSASFLCPPFSKQVLEFVLPTLARLDSPLPFGDLVHSLLTTSVVVEAIVSESGATANAVTPVASRVPDVRLRVPASPWLLYAILTLSANRTESLSENFIWPYLQLLKLLMPTLNLPGNNASDEDVTSDDEEEPTMDSDSQLIRSDGRDSILVRTTAMINEPSHVQLLLSAMGSNCNDHSRLMALCHLCHNLLIQHKLAIHNYRLLHTLAFRPEFLRYLWHTITKVSTSSLFGSPTSLLQLMARGIPLSYQDGNQLGPVLALFCSLFSYFLQTLHDSEFYGERHQTDEPPTGPMPFNLIELAAIGLALRDVCLGLVDLAYANCRPNLRDNYVQVVLDMEREDSLVGSPVDEDRQLKMLTHLFKVTAKLVRQLHSRDTRRRFCAKDHWLAKHVSIPIHKPSDLQLRHGSANNHQLRFGVLSSASREQLEEGPPMSATKVRNIIILRELPFVVPFYDRVMILQQLVLKDREENIGESHNFLAGPQIQILVRRNYLYEDAYEKLSLENEPNLKLKMRVQLVNFVGLDEAGIDGGGIFREFISELILEAFNPNLGFFMLTSDNLLYPNPNVHLLLDNFTKHYYFIGRILGKAIYENMLIELPLASFFLSKLLGRNTANLDIDHLNSLDPVLYRNLLSLKEYNGDVIDLGLDFTVVNEELGETKVEELMPGGSKMAVTEANKIKYIHLMANYKLNRQIHAQCTAFKQGLFNVLNPEWLQMFDWKELQVLISGAHIPVNAEDLRHHTNYAGTYTAEHPVIKLFWKVVTDFNDKQRGMLLKFVTSCSRPPLLGFKELFPAFCIQSAGTEERLPTSSTCMNLLKLPEFKDEHTLKSKLLYAIEAGSGFELS